VSNSEQAVKFSPKSVDESVLVGVVWRGW